MTKNYPWTKDADEWLDYCQSTNDYCERNLIIAALIALEEDNPQEAKCRLLQIFSGGSKLVNVPDHVLAAGESDESN